MKTILWFGLFCFMLAGNPAHAKIFKWVDENGKTHFTDDPTKIPKKQGTKIDTIRELPPPVRNNVTGKSDSSGKPGELLEGLGSASQLEPQGENNGLPSQLDEKQIENIKEQLESFKETLKESQDARDQQLKALDEFEGSKSKTESGKSRYPKY
jgi:hypothetical protein